MNHQYLVIMAGGIGSRFWPGSRNHRPKQFLDILGLGKSLLRLTFERFLPQIPASNILVVTHRDYRELVQTELPELQADQILCEPSRNNTAPCVAYAAFKIAKKDPDAVFVVAPSDHLILKETEFLAKINQGLEFVAKHDALLTLGIQPNRPNTGYGYIQCGPAQGQGLYKVERFREKPDLETAKAFLAQGGYLWNAGIFLAAAQNILHALASHQPSLYAQMQAGLAHYWTESEQAFIDEVYPQTPNISIDYAIMEKADNIYTLPADIGWSDLGTWASLYEQMPKDGAENASNAPSQHILLDTKGCLFHLPKDKLLIAKGLQDVIVVDDGEVLLIYPRAEEQEIKALQQKVKEDFDGKYS